MPGDALHIRVHCGVYQGQGVDLRRRSDIRIEGVEVDPVRQRVNVVEAGAGAEQGRLRLADESDDVGPPGAEITVPLGHIDYKKSRKRVHAYAAQLPAGAAPRCAC